MRRVVLLSAFALLSFAMQSYAREASASKQKIDCSLAPSQSATVKSISSAAGGASATAYALAQATGLTVVSHSSGAYILTGAGGYLAGTLGAGALVGPAIIGVGLLVGGAAVTVELICAPKNHPGQVAKIKDASKEFMRRSGGYFKKAPEALANAKNSAVVATKNTVVKAKESATDIYEYAYRASDSLHR